MNCTNKFNKVASKTWDYKGKEYVLWLHDNAGRKIQWCHKNWLARIRSCIYTKGCKAICSHSKADISRIKSKFRKVFIKLLPSFTITWVIHSIRHGARSFFVPSHHFHCWLIYVELLACSARLCVGPYLSHQHSEGYHKYHIFLYACYLYNKACSCCNIHEFIHKACQDPSTIFWNGRSP